LLRDLEGYRRSREDTIGGYGQRTKLLLAAQEKLNQAEQKVLLLSEEGIANIESDESKTSQ